MKADSNQGGQVAKPGWICLTLIVGGILLGSTLVMAQPEGDGRRPAKADSSSDELLGRDAPSLLADENVKNELGVTAKQLAKLKEFQAKTRHEMRQAIRELRNLSFEDRTGELQELQKRMAEATVAGEQSVLLPKQLERLREIRVQFRLHQGSPAGALLSDEISQQLGLTDAQHEALKQAQQEVDAEMGASINRLREAARQKVLSILSAEQQAKLKLLTGESIQFSGATRNKRLPLGRPPEGD